MRVPPQDFVGDKMLFTPLLPKTETAFIVGEERRFYTRAWIREIAPKMYEGALLQITEIGGRSVWLGKSGNGCPIAFCKFSSFDEAIETLRQFATAYVEENAPIHR